MSEHTATRYLRYETHEDLNYAVIYEGDTHVATVHDDDDEELADFIVTACNSFDAMREALDWALDMVELRAKELNAAPGNQILVDILLHKVKQARAALSPSPSTPSAATELAELKAKLPKLLDGPIAVIGMTVWDSHSHAGFAGPNSATLVGYVLGKLVLDYGDGEGFESTISWNCYSTEAAAREARK